LLERWKMNFRRTQGSKHPANASKIERTIFLMFALGGFDRIQAVALAAEFK